MSDMNVLPVDNNNGFGGLGSGFLGGLIGGALFGGGFGGWGFNRGGNGVGSPVSSYDAGMLTGLGNQVAHANDAAVAAQMAVLQNASNQNMFMGNLINQTGDSITSAITQGTMTGIQNSGAVQTALGSINQNITTQGFETQLNAQRLAAQGQQQFCQLSHAIFEEGCKNRELQRQIASEQQATALADAKAQVASLQAQINLTQQLAASQSAQNAYLISALKTTATTTP